MTIVPALAAGTAGSGDLALVVGTVGALGFLPRMASRLIARTKNTEVSFARMATLLPAGSSLESRAAEISRFTYVPFFVDPACRSVCSGSARPALLEARGLVAVHPGGGGVAADLVVEPHSFVVVTGSVGREVDPAAGGARPAPAAGRVGVVGRRRAGGAAVVAAGGLRAAGAAAVQRAAARRGAPRAAGR